MSNELILTNHHLSRRALLQAFAAGTLLLVQGCAGSSRTEPQGAPTSEFSPDVEIKLTAQPGSTAILPGAPTDTWSYQGEVIKGDASAVINLPGTYLGPLLRLRKGQKVRIHLQNELPEETIIHWHGLIVPSSMDGHPSSTAAVGKSYVYEFEVKNRAGTYWFHPHSHGTTASQVIKGLAGLAVVSDDEEDKFALPSGDFDIPLVLQDRTFDTLNQFVYNVKAMAGMSDMGNMSMEAMMGFLGETILVNGHPSVRLPVATRAYRLRLLNGSNSRIYKLAWSNGAPLTVIATDGGLLEKPVQRNYITLAPGERIDLWADFSQQKVGDEITLRSLAYTGVEASTMQSEAKLPNGAEFDILTINVEREEKETATLPAQLAQLAGNRPEDAVNLSSPRPFALSMSNMQWLINDKQFEMEAVDQSEKVAFNSLEVWEFINQQGVAAMGAMSGSHSMAGMDHSKMKLGNNQEMMNDFMAHPMHIHGVQFQVIERQMDPNYEAGWATLKEGLVDEGWKDTVLVMPGERVKILLRFNDYAGRYLVHCHNLEHESMGMMRNYLIEK